MQSIEIFLHIVADSLPESRTFKQISLYNEKTSNVYSTIIVDIIFRPLKELLLILNYCNIFIAHT